MAAAAPLPPPTSVSAAATLTAALPDSTPPAPLQTRVRATVDRLKPTLGADATVMDHRLAALRGPSGQTVQVKATTYQPASTGAKKALAVIKGVAWGIFATPFAFLNKSVRDSLATTWAGGHERTVYSASLSPAERASVNKTIQESRLLPNSANKGTYSVNTQEGRAAFARERYNDPAHKREFTVVEGSGMYWIDNKNARIVFVPEGRFGEPDFEHTRSFVATDTKTGKHITDRTKLARTAYQFTISYNDYGKALEAAKEKGLKHLLADSRINRDLDSRMEQLAPLVGYEKIKALNTRRIEDIDAALDPAQNPSPEQTKSLKAEKERLLELNKKLDKKERSLTVAINAAPGPERPRLQAIHDRFEEGEIAFLTRQLNLEINGANPNQPKIDDLTAELQEAKKSLQRLMDGRFCNYEIDDDTYKPILLERGDSYQIVSDKVCKLNVDDDGNLTTRSADLQQKLDDALAVVDDPDDDAYLSPSQRDLLHDTIRHVKGYEAACAKIDAIVTDPAGFQAADAETQAKLKPLQLEAGFHLESLFHSGTMATHSLDGRVPNYGINDNYAPYLLERENSRQLLPEDIFELEVNADGKITTTHAELQARLDAALDPGAQDPTHGDYLSPAQRDLLQGTIRHMQEYETACAGIHGIVSAPGFDPGDPATRTNLARLQSEAGRHLEHLFDRGPVVPAQTLAAANAFRDAVDRLFDADDSPLVEQLRTTEQQKLLREEAIEAYQPRQIIIDPKEKSLRVASVYLKPDPDTGELRPSANLDNPSVGLTLKMPKEWEKKFLASYTESLEKTFTKEPYDPTKVLPPAAPPKRKPPGMPGMGGPPAHPPGHPSTQLPSTAGLNPFSGVMPSGMGGPPQGVSGSS